MDKIIHILSMLLVFTLLFIYLINVPIEATNGGFSLELIHRDSPNSPLYKPYETPLKRFNDMFRRTSARLNSLGMVSSFYTNDAQTDVSAENGQYLMKLSVGTPPVDVFGIVDTGSDLMWLQCQPCEQCYKQINPIFNPTVSSSYSKLSCQSNECHLLPTTCSPTQICNYSYGYADGSLTQGILSTERIVFGSSSETSTSFDDIVFGCGHNNTGVFNEYEMGLIGLGGGDLSLASQIMSRTGARKFSYCLVPFHTDPSIPSKMNFGSGSEVSGDGVVSTPLIPKDDKTFYFVTLEGISVGTEFIPYVSSGTISKGNIFLDSGTPPTLVPQDFYNRLEQAVRNSIELTPYQDPQLGSQLCYKSETIHEVAPILTAHFDGDVQVPLIQTSTFIHPPVEGVYCFAMQPIDGEVGIFGNFAQSNILIGYDREKQIVSFKPTDCTKQ